MPEHTTHTVELSLEGLVGPTHNYAGLSPGNLASQHNKNLTSKPKTAALQALDKAHFLTQLGIPVLIFPPQPRPRLDILRALGFNGSNQNIIKTACKQAPHLLASVYSASSMWAANAATVTPSTDATDNKLHFTPANLTSNLHRSLETHHTANVLKQLFPDSEQFHHHPPLPTSSNFSDEGAANHTRLCADYSSPGLHLFTYNKSNQTDTDSPDTHHPDVPEGDGRQSFQASRSLAHQHQIEHNQRLFIHQHPCAVEVGVFHNDVIATGNRNLFLYHENAYLNPDILNTITEHFCALSNQSLHIRKITNDHLPLKDAVESYFFNSQIISPTPKDQILIAPLEVKQNKYAFALVEHLLEQNILTDAHYLNVRQSMQNGGGPACLRLRVPITTDQLKHVHIHALLTPKLYEQLTNIINDHYRDSLAPDDLADPTLITDANTALKHIYHCLQLNYTQNSIS
ncbi:N-succinylarginine dihydrolase [Planctomycetota bacterium]|nr:N-succinylarginine dihydrolase [Planctomycetota bacterium]